MPLTFLVTHHSCYERSVGCKCNGKRVIFKILFLCVCASKFAQATNLLICIRKVLVSNSGKDNDYPGQYFPGFLRRREKKIEPGSLLRVTNILCRSVGSPVSVCNGRLNGLP